MTATIQPPKTKISLEDFLQMPETKPACEYIDGEIIQKPMVKIQHSILQAKLLLAINEQGNPQQLVYAFPELRCVFGGRVIVPDITVLQWERVPTNEVGEVQGEIDFYPDWIIEVLSPEQSTTKVIKKILLCLEEGTELGWLIDPEEREIFVFQPGLPTKACEGSDPLPMLDVLKDWQLTPADIFGWLSFKNKASKEV